MVSVCHSARCSASWEPIRARTGSTMPSPGTSTASSSPVKTPERPGSWRRARPASMRPATCARAPQSGARPRSVRVRRWSATSTIASRPSRSEPLAGYGALGGGRHRRRVLRHDAALVVRLRRHVRLDPLRDLLVGEVHVEAAGVDVEGDHVAVLDGRDRAAPDRLGSDVAGHQAVGGSRETAVGEQRHLVADALPDERGRDLEHLAHAGAAGRALVANHDDVAGLDALLLDHRKALLLGTEDPGGAGVLLSLLARNLDDTALRREVAAQDHETAGGLERIVKRTDDLLRRRLLSRVGLLADRPARHGDRLGVEQTRLVEALGENTDS